MFNFKIFIEMMNPSLVEEDCIKTSLSSYRHTNRSNNKQSNKFSFKKHINNLVIVVFEYDTTPTQTDTTQLQIYISYL